MDINSLMSGTIFFEPDTDFVNWIIDRADGRIIFDIGCGSAHFLKELKRNGHHGLIGIDPYLDLPKMIMDIRQEFNEPIHLLPCKIGDGLPEKLLSETPERFICTLCRPCHHPLLVVEAYNLCKNLGVELLYIGLEKNVHLDLISYGIPFEKLEHEGTSESDEIVLKLV